MKTMRSLAAFFFGIGCMSVSISASATISTFTDLAAFNSSATSLSMDGFESFQPTSEVYELDSAHFVVRRLDGQTMRVTSGIPAMSGNALVTGYQPLELQFEFDTTIRSFGIFVLDLGDIGNTVNLSMSTDAGDSAIILSNFSGPSFSGPLAGQFVGLISDIAFSKVTIYIQTQSGSPGDGVYWDNAYYGQAVAPPVKVVDIDIKPDSMSNSINPRSYGSIAVAILSDTMFDATSEIAVSTLTFGRVGNEASLLMCGPAGVLNLVCHFSVQAAGFHSGDTQGVLRGETISGERFRGTDAIRIVPGTQ